MSDLPVPKAPSKLGPAGRRLWSSVVPAYHLRPDELRVLEDACRCADMVEQLEKLMEGDDLMVYNSQGAKLHPAVDTLRRYRATMGTLLRQLSLPDVGTAVSAAESERKRAAARARWDRVAKSS
ncbi:P27 family phage terminase small subunit [Streptomyces sp. NPDC048507]|uniref:P27 family phage terminase small subunit n=1 Tax=Streptomyces sp. NPDC048507 TaxID=3365560 RepID=UPI00371F82B3